MITTEDLEKLKQYPQLDEVIGKREIADPVDYMFGTVAISESLGKALQNDPEIEDAEEIPMIVKSFKWLEGPILPTHLTLKKWNTFKVNVIRKDKYLQSVFSQNKLRRSSFDHMIFWFDLYPSLFCQNKSAQDFWANECKKFTKNRDLAEIAAAAEEDGEGIMNEPSIYDIYDVEQKLALVRKLTPFINTVLVNYIQKHTIE